MTETDTDTVIALVYYLENSESLHRKQAIKLLNKIIKSYGL